MDLETAKGTLVQEARELLVDMEIALLEIESEGVDDERINAIFRAAHTIKGSAGLFALDAIVGFTHVMESVLVRVRNGEITLGLELTSLLLRCGDHVSSLINQIEADGSDHDPDPAARASLLAALEQHLDSSSVPTREEPTPSDTASAQRWQISLRFSEHLLRGGMDPLSFLQYLERLGRIESIATVCDALPTLADMDPEACYLGYELVLSSAAGKEAILSTFEFIAEDSNIAIEPLDIPTALEAETNPGVNADKQVERQQRERRTADRGYLKVEAQKLDLLIDAVGEMVIAAASVRVAASQQNGALRESIADLENLVEQIRDRALNLRMTPIGEVFQRFPRVVRDIAQELGKKIELSIEGADAELDKSMVEKLSDPLMHIVRNAMDHGIEPTAERVMAGKPEQGALKLNAYHESGSIVVEISDDGRGLDRQRIRGKAIERGLIAEDAVLSEQEIFALIFEAGFSTAERVTNLSGRGVGMDVVRQNIEQMRGSVEIESQEGKGSTFRIRLPLTMAIIDGFQVTLGKSNFIIPLDMVEECVDIRGSAETGNVVRLRGEALPYLDLAAAFDIEPSSNGHRSLVVVRNGQRRAGLLVDSFVGELQAVIKPLGRLLQGVNGLGGSTILGDGSVALILDVATLLAQISAKSDVPASASI